MHLDYTVYPDLDNPPQTLDTIEGRADYVARVCAAWDFGVVPTEATFSLFSDWLDAFDFFALDHSVAYHAFRAWYRWPAIPSSAISSTDDEDRRKGRTDPCSRMI